MNRTERANKFRRDVREAGFHLFKVFYHIEGSEDAVPPKTLSAILDQKFHNLSNINCVSAERLMQAFESAVVLKNPDIILLLLDEETSSFAPVGGGRWKVVSEPQTYYSFKELKEDGYKIQEIVENVAKIYDVFDEVVQGKDFGSFTGNLIQDDFSDARCYVRVKDPEGKTIFHAEDKDSLENFFYDNFGLEIPETE